MAQVLFNPQIDGIIGKIGNETYSRVQSGYIVKKSPNPGKRNRINPSGAQIKFRSYFSQVQRSWITCSLSQMEAWHVIASKSTFINKFGMKYTGDGYHLFLRLNQNRLIIGESIVLDAPCIQQLHQIPAATLIVSGAPDKSLIFSYDSSYFFAETTYIVYCSPPLSPGIRYINNEWRNIAVMPINDSGLCDITTVYLRYYKDIVAGKKIFLKLIPVHIPSGTPGIPVYSSCVLIK